MRFLIFLHFVLEVEFTRELLCRYRSPKEQDGEVLSIAADAEVLTTKGEHSYERNYYIDDFEHAYTFLLLTIRKCMATVFMDFF